MNDIDMMTSGTGTITVLHFVLILVLAVFTIVMIVRGVRSKRRRVQAQREVAAHAEQAGVTPVEIAAAGDPPAPPPVPAPTPAPAPEPEPVETRAPDPLDDEPLAAASAFDASPAEIASSAPTEAPAPAQPPAPPPAQPVSFADGSITQLKGLGPKVATRLGELGITTVGQIAALDDDRAALLDAQLGAFAGRMGRDRWIEQARFLAAGDKAGFEAVFGKL